MAEGCWKRSHGSGEGEGAFDRDGIAEEVEHRTMGVDRVGELPIARIAFRACEGDADANGVETRANRVVESEETARKPGFFALKIGLRKNQKGRLMRAALYILKASSVPASF